jgi:hypothetical protein
MFDKLCAPTVIDIRLFVSVQENQETSSIAHQQFCYSIVGYVSLTLKPHSWTFNAVTALIKGKCMLEKCSERRFNVN